MLQTARLRGYARYAVKGEGYPGVTRNESVDIFVEGTLVLNIKDEDLSRLDEFEGDEYERMVLSDVADAMTVAGEAVTDEVAGGVCWIYLWKGDPARLEGEWIPGPDFSADAVYIPREGV